MHTMTLVGIARPITHALAVLAAATILFAAAPSTASAQDVGVKELESLAATIQDDAKRKEFLGHLNALIEARKGTAPEEAGGFGARMIAELSKGAAATGREVVNGLKRLSDLPVLWAWLEKKAMDAENRAVVLGGLVKLALILGIGFAVEYGGAVALARPRRILEERTRGSTLVKAGRLALRTLLDLAPATAFAATAYGALVLAQPSSNAYVVAITFINAYVAVRFSSIVIRMILAPQVEALRLIRIGDETANYLFIWARRLIVVAVFGYSAAQAAVLLGLPYAGYGGLIRLLGLIVAAMIVVLILQNRKAVAKWVRGKRGGKDTAVRKLRQRVSDIWHTLAIIYVGAAYGIWALAIPGGFRFLIQATVGTAVILIVLRFAIDLTRRLVERAFSVSDDVRRRFPRLEARVNRYVPVVHLTLRAVLLGLAALALLQTWGLGGLEWLETDVGRRILGSAITIGLVLVVALLIWEGVSSAIERYLNRIDADGTMIARSARTRTLLPMLRNAFLVLLLVMVALIVLSELGVNTGPLLAGAGVVGLAIGFGSQKMVQDVITGAFILFEDTIAVGDVATVGGLTGVVEAMSIRSIRLRDVSGTVHTVPFSSVDTVSNMTKEFSMAVFEVGVAYRENVDDVMTVLRELGAEMRADPDYGPLIIEDMEILGVDAFADSAVIIKARIKTLPIKQWSVMREFNRRMKNRFDALNIEIPFPHQTIYFGVDREGKAPPAFVQQLTPASRSRKAKKKPDEEQGSTDAPVTADDAVDLPG